ncbi:MAG: Stk1 family PASTA domain-containing Ser/Thr kinase [Actinomycetota bacterium]|nr:Stk1 family PASTA domain-containing Ser/Thr kinase [Actinomycetota bacterium]
MHTATVDPLVGRTLEGRYRILDPIARGGMSTVYSAIDERLDRLVAVKVMSAALSADPAFSDRFTREARAAARLTHLNTVSVYDQGSDFTGGGQHVFLVMELVAGRTLRDLIRERGHLAPAEAVSIMEPVLSALSAAHRAGIVHRDVKPENILLSDDGVVKVADFGLARAIGADPQVTRTGLMMGTVAYCAPEQISKGRADQRSDVYAAGIVFFELLTGSPPYEGDSAMNVAYQHVHSRVPAPSSRVRGIPSEIDELVVSATDSDPASRPLDASVFLAELADVRSNLALPIVAVPPRPRAVNRPHSSQGRAAASGAAGERTDVIGPGATAHHDTSVVPRRVDSGRDGLPPAPPVITSPPKQRKRLSPRARRRRRSLVALIIVVLLGAAAVYGGWWFASGRYGRVPNVAGQAEAAAITALRHAGYQVSSVVTSQFSETVPAGDVLSTNPGVGSREAHGRTISLVISRGLERFTLPPVANMTEGQARTALAAIPVVVAPNPASQNNDTVPSGRVIGTVPAVGTKVKRGQSVTIVVSAGPQLFAIPPVVPNTPVADEEQALQRLGFRTTAVTVFSTAVAQGNVISISPTGQAPKATMITITASKGPATVVIPDIPQLTPVDQATTELEQLGLQVKIEKAFGGNLGRVVGVYPAVGTVVPVGSKVTLSIV